MRAILEKLGQDPHASLRIFLKGLGLFILGVGFLALGYYFHHYWQVLAIVFIGIGCLFSIWGYVGILANRFLNVLEKTKPK